MYKKILVPIDGSDNSLKTLAEAAKLASVLGSQVTLLHVIAPLPASVQGYFQTKGVVEELHKYGEELLQNAKESVSPQYNLDIETDIIHGDPASEICEKAKREKFDLIVIGSRGLSQIASIIMGSVSRRVVRHASCPVLIVR